MGPLPLEDGDTVTPISAAQVGTVARGALIWRAETVLGRRWNRAGTEPSVLVPTHAGPLPRRGAHAPPSPLNRSRQRSCEIR